MNMSGVWIGTSCKSWIKPSVRSQGICDITDGILHTELKNFLKVFECVRLKYLQKLKKKTNDKLYINKNK